MTNAVVLEHVWKMFRRYPVRGHTTLKDVVVRAEWRKRFKGRQHIEALRDVSLDVPQGLVLGIIGANGSGKSTLLRLIAGIYRPSAGRIVVTGRVAALLHLGLGFHPELSGRENIIIGGLAAGLSRYEVRRSFDEIVEFAELREFIDAPVRTYSSGMYARLAFSVAVHVNPDILLLDEVLAVGDERFSEKSKQRMDRFKKEGKTILFVSHGLDKVAEWCHEAVWLEVGQVRARGPAEAVVREYRESCVVDGGLGTPATVRRG